MSKTERIVLSVLVFVLVVSLAMLVRSFMRENTKYVGVEGGTYIEGSVGEVLPLNPWFTTSNDVTHDIVSLIFSGLMKYDPISQKVIDDLATVESSRDNRIYTATLRDGLLWHDSTAENPHPVTADDVLFTFATIQSQGFQNPILQQNFKGVDIEKINERTVRFKLSKPYSFFTSNLTLGLLPKKSFEGVSPETMRDTLDFGLHPVGAGPYEFVSILQTDLSTEVTLKKFKRNSMPPYNIDRVVFRVFSDYPSLLTDIMNLSGVRLVPRNAEGLPILPKNFKAMPFTLPQYVGLFFNLDRPIPADPNVRLGLQLGTNKKDIVKSIHEANIIDTPLLEINLGDWRYEFDAKAAQGAFFESSWNMPEKVRLQKLLEQREANALGPLKSVNRVVYLGTGAELVLTGSVANLKFPLWVNDFKTSTGSSPMGRSGTGVWTVKIPAGNGMSGTLKLGVNIVKMTDEKGDIVDSAFLERFLTSGELALAQEEQRLVDSFLTSKKLPADDPKKITVNDMYLDNGFLRKKKENDPPHTRINERGKELTITILTSSKPDNYPKIAALLQKQWSALGAKVILDIPKDTKEFQEKMLKRQYDVILFGQSLFDNLDSYPYWHSSQIQEREDPKKMRLDAFNLSQYASFDVDVLLAKIRETGEGKSRQAALASLEEILKKDRPAIILYTPLYIFGYNQNVHGISIGKLALYADRFGTFAQWYVSEKREFLPGKSWLSFLPWILHQK